MHHQTRGGAEPHRGLLSFSKAPITMEATESRVRFSGPESSVDMEVMRGFNGHKGTNAFTLKWDVGSQ